MAAVIAPAASAAAASGEGPTLTAPGAAYSVSRVSVADDGSQARNGTRFPEAPAVSSSGRYVAFVSLSPDLVAGDTNGQPDVFVRDRLAGTTVRASVDSSGAQVPAASTEATMSANGRVVLFSTEAALVSQDTNTSTDIYARDLWAGTTTLVSATPSGRPANRPCFFPSVSRDGRLVAFQTAASNLSPDDTDKAEDVYVRDLRSGTVRRASVLPTGAGPVAAAFEPRLALDGRSVLFATLGLDDRVRLWVRSLDSTAARRVPGLDPRHTLTSWQLSGNGRYVALATDEALDPRDDNGDLDAYRLDRVTGRATLLSQSTTGGAALGSDVVALSADGSVALFTSRSAQLVPHDTNGFVDVFRRDLSRSTTTRVSVSTAGAQGDSESGYTQDVAISADGAHLAFVSFATTLVAVDTNGDPDVFVWDAAAER
ncbi:hypothetical protein V3N99_08490 [Dermatophilaceae bacterium Soc4.6]